MIVEGIQIRIPQARKKALGIITAMERVLQMRHHYHLTRRQFLVKWAALRKALFLTRDYQELRQRVIADANGTCQICFNSSADHIHHVVRVSRNPRLALVQTNCQAVCRDCHEEID